MSDELTKQWRLELAQDIVSGKEKHELNDAARLLEDEIERRDLWREYATALIRAVAPGAEEATVMLWYVGPIDVWYIARATPEQRAQAFLKAVGDG